MHLQLIESGVLVLTADERQVFTPEVLCALEKFDRDTHPTLQQWHAYHKLETSMPDALILSMMHRRLQGRTAICAAILCSSFAKAALKVERTPVFGHALVV